MEDDQSLWKKLSESIVIHCVGLGNDGGGERNHAVTDAGTGRQRDRERQ